MKKKIFITVYCILVSLIFAGTIIFSGVSLYTENNKGYLESKRKFDSMSIELRKAFENPDSNNMADKISHAIGSYENYSFINIKINGKTIFLYPGDTENPGENTRFSRLYFTSVKAGDLNLYVQANVYTLTPQTIAFYAKISFIIVLIFTILTILIIVLTASEEEKEETVEESIENETTEEITEDNSEENAEETIEPVESEITEEVTNEEPVVEVPEEEKNTENETVIAEEPVIDSSEDTEIDIQVNMEPEIDQEPVINEEPVSLPVEDCKPSTEVPSGLFSPVTGFGWESYLKTRLDSELIRASSSEFDLTLFIIKITGIARDSETMKKVADVLTSYFQFKDLVFEYKEDCFAGIKTSTTIDMAIPAADDLYSGISKIVNEENGKCFIGLSSKTIRLIGAERLLKEADAALMHAQEEEDCPIIAFRADAEKYMDFVENN